MARVVREWTLLEEVGRGGMGVVYSATHEILTGAWAVKVIRPELSEDKESRLRFLQEASILARMQHPNIVATQTPFLEGGQIYLPMEYLSGQSLEQILKADGTLWSAERAVNIIRQVAAGLGYAHRQSPAVLHRDIKPGNIQLLDDGGVKVLDFGLARTLGDNSMTGTGKAVGTPAYMAPEVLEGRKASPRSDIYSLGVVLYRLLAGRLPYDMPEEDSSIQAVFMAVARGLDRGLPDVREFAALTPTALANLTMSTLSRASEGRPADGADLAGLLGRVDTRPLLPKSQNMAEYSADSTRLGIDLNSVTGKKPAMDNGSGIERSSPTPSTLKLVPKQEDADSSLIGLDLPGAGIKPREKSVHSAPEPANEGRKIDSVNAIVESSQSRKFRAFAERRKRSLWLVPAAVGVLVVWAVSLSIVTRQSPEPVKATAPMAGDESSATTLTPSFSAVEAVADVPAVTEAQPVNLRPIPTRPVVTPSQPAAPARTDRSPESSPDANWVLIPGGSFEMGAALGDADERQVRRVAVPSFQMMRSEVTMGQYQRCVREGACEPVHAADGQCWVGHRRGSGWKVEKGMLPASFQGADMPVVCVSWHQAQQYARWSHARLPSEAEWEYAARSGGKNRPYAWGARRADCSLAVLEDSAGKGCGMETPAPVCSRESGNSEQGLCDLAGNVWEWVQDDFTASYQGAPTDESARQDAGGARKVCRGGSWRAGPAEARATNRFSDIPNALGDHRGFRLAR